jgi:hypothetical protein
MPVAPGILEMPLPRELHNCISWGLLSFGCLSVGRITIMSGSAGLRRRVGLGRAASRCVLVSGAAHSPQSIKPRNKTQLSPEGISVVSGFFFVLA